MNQSEEKGIVSFPDSVTPGKTQLKTITVPLTNLSN